MCKTRRDSVAKNAYSSFSCLRIRKIDDCPCALARGPIHNGVPDPNNVTKGREDKVHLQRTASLKLSSIFPWYCNCSLRHSMKDIFILVQGKTHNSTHGSFHIVEHPRELQHERVRAWVGGARTEQFAKVLFWCSRDPRLQEHQHLLCGCPGVKAAHPNAFPGKRNRPCLLYMDRRVEH